MDLAVLGGRFLADRTAMNSNESRAESADDFSAKLKKLYDRTIDEWYAAKHPRPGQDEVDFVNSLEVNTCPYCGSRDLKRNGHSSATGLAIRMCRACGRKFNPLNGTIFDSRKIPISEWFEFLTHLFQYHSIATSSADNRNADSTGRYWLSKVFLALEDYQDKTMLSGRVYIDETYVPVWSTRAVNPGDGKRNTGLSKSQICIATAVDDSRCYLAVAGAGKPSISKTMRAYSGHIDPGSTLIHDGKNSHHALVAALKLDEEVHTTRETRGLKDRDHPLARINSVHRSLKLLLSRHPGFSREQLQGWLNLFAFDQNSEGDPFAKAEALIAYAVKKRAKLRYRAWQNLQKT